MTAADRPLLPMGALSFDQRRVVMIAWGTYAAFYLGRLNLSPALPRIAETLNIGLGEVGILGTVFFWCYAVGQVITGQIGNTIPPHWVILSGMVLIAVANIAFAFQTSLLALAILWGINGFGQAAGWGPMLRIIASHLSVPQRQRLSTVFSMSFQVGTAISWGISALLIAVASWRMAFWVPGVLLLFAAVHWRWRSLDAEVSAAPRQPFQLRAMFKEIWQLSPILVTAACVGFVYLGFFLWLPTFMTTSDFLPDWTVRGLTAFAPLIGIPGMHIAGMLLARQSNLLRTMTQMLLGLVVCLLLSYLTTSLMQTGFVLLAVMIVSGMAGLLLSAAPMLLAVDKRVSSAGGLITAVWSVAGGMAGTIVGSVAERSGWPVVFLLWMGFTCTAIGAVQVAARWMRPAHKGVEQ